MKEWILIFVMYNEGHGATQSMLDGFTSRMNCQEAGIKLLSETTRSVSEYKKMLNIKGIEQPSASFTCAEIEK